MRPPRPLTDRVKQLNTLFDNDPILQPLRDLGFTRQNISNVVGTTNEPRTFAKVAKCLAIQADLIKSIQASTKLNANNIASILSKSAGKATEAINALAQNESILLELTNAGFTPSNISSMLSGTGAYAGTSIPILASQKKNLLELIEAGFSAKTISNMLSKSGIHIGNSINELASKKNILFGLIKLGFSTTDIPFILSGSSKYIGEAITALDDHKYFLCELIRDAQTARANFKTKDLCLILKGCNRKLEPAILALEQNKEIVLDLIKAGAPIQKISSIFNQNLSKTDHSIPASSNQKKPPALLGKGNDPVETDMWGKRFFDVQDDIKVLDGELNYLLPNKYDQNTSRKRPASDAFGFGLDENAYCFDQSADSRLNRPF